MTESRCVSSKIVTVTKDNEYTAFLIYQEVHAYYQCRRGKMCVYAVHTSVHPIATSWRTHCWLRAGHGFPSRAANSGGVWGEGLSIKHADRCGGHERTGTRALSRSARQLIYRQVRWHGSSAPGQRRTHLALNVFVRSLGMHVSCAPNAERAREREDAMTCHHATIN